MALTNQQIDAANELFNRGLNTDGQPLSDQQKEAVSALKQKGDDPARILLSGSDIERTSQPTPTQPQEGVTERLGAGILQGLANIAPQTANLLRQRLRQIAPPLIPGEAGRQLPQVQFPETATTAGRVGQALGQAVPFVTGLGGVESAVAEEPLLARLGARFGTAGGISAIQEPEAPRAGLERGLGAQAVAEAVSPVLSPALVGLSALAKAPIGIAKKGFLNLMRALPGGLEGVRNVVNNQLGKIGNLLKGDSSVESVRQDLFDKMRNNYNAAEDASRSGFDKLQSDPRFSNIEIDVPKTKNVIRDQLDKVGPKLAFTAPEDPQFAEIEKAKDWLQGKLNTAEGRGTVRPGGINNLETSKLFREGINADLRNKTLVDATPIIKNMGPAIKKALDDELANNVAETGNQDLLDEWKQANEIHKEFVTKWKTEPGLRKGTSKPTVLNDLIEQKDPSLDKLFNLIKPNIKRDDVSGINKLFSWLPEQSDRNRLAYDLVKTGENDPEAFMRSYSKLGPKQKSLLFPQHQEELDQLQGAFKRFPSAFKAPQEEGRLAKRFEGQPLMEHQLSLVKT
jgi:hypothetical protein